MGVVVLEERKKSLKFFFLFFVHQCCTAVECTESRTPDTEGSLGVAQRLFLSSTAANFHVNFDIFISNDMGLLTFSLILYSA